MKAAQNRRKAKMAKDTVDAMAPAPVSQVSKALASPKPNSGPLSTAERNSLPSSSFAIPSERSYPINDLNHGKNALARVSQYGTPAEKAKVKKKVIKRYPGLAPGV